MKKRDNKLFNKQLIVYYQCALAIGGIVVFFTELDNYTLRIGIGVPPKFLVLLFLILATPLFAELLSRLPYLSRPLLMWCGFYLGVSSVYLLFSPPYEPALQELETRLLAVIFLLNFHITFSRYSLALASARWAVFGVTIMNVTNHILQFFNPDLFGEVDVPGRASGFYADSNMAGCALIIGFILSVNILPKVLRFPFFIVVLIGVILTFSRGAMLSLFIITTLFFIQGLIPRKQFIAWGGTLLIVSLTFGSLLFSVVSIQKLQASGYLTEDTAGRIDAMVNPLEETESLEEDSRTTLAKAGWNAFAEKPFLGNGIGYTLYWKVDRRSTHNMLLFYMVDHGLLGIFIFPLAIYAAIKGARGDCRFVGQGFTVMMFIWSFFSHTMLSTRVLLIIFALMASLTRSSQINPEYLQLRGNPK